MGHLDKYLRPEDEDQNEIESLEKSLGLREDPIEQSDPLEEAVLEKVKEAESSVGGYDAMNRLKGQEGLSKEPISEVKRLQDILRKSKESSGAAGAYQLTPTSIDEAMKREGISSDEEFSPEIQDQMASGILNKKRKFEDFKRGEISTDAMGKNLAKEWAGLPLLADDGDKSRGESYYQEKYGNRANQDVPPEELEDILNDPSLMQSIGPAAADVNYEDLQSREVDPSQMISLGEPADLSLEEPVAPIEQLPITQEEIAPELAEQLDPIEPQINPEVQISEAQRLRDILSESRRNRDIMEGMSELQRGAERASAAYGGGEITQIKPNEQAGDFLSGLGQRGVEDAETDLASERQGRKDAEAKEIADMRKLLLQSQVDLAGKPEESKPMSEYQRRVLDLKEKEFDRKDSKETKKEDKPSAAEIQVDKEFAKEYNEFVTAGGYADVKKQLDQLREVSKKLPGMIGASGPGVGLVPKVIRDITPGLSEGAAMQDAVEEVVQRNLRLVLGAQFTEKEGERLIERAYNPRQSEEENKKRLDRLIDQIDSAAKSKTKAADYYEKNGTLRGFKGESYKAISDFDPRIEDFMKKNKIKDREKAVEILKKAGKL